jgi:hypothetical protein
MSKNKINILSRTETRGNTAYGDHWIMNERNAKKYTRKH